MSYHSNLTMPAKYEAERVKENGVRAQPLKQPRLEIKAFHTQWPYGWKNQERKHGEHTEGIWWTD